MLARAAVNLGVGNLSNIIPNGLSNLGPPHGGRPTNNYMKHRLGGWMPESPKDFYEWLDKTAKHVRKHHRKAPEEMHSSIKAMWDMIDSKTDLRMLFSMMFQQIPMTPPYQTDPTDQWCVENWQEMLQILDYLLNRGPEWLYDTEGQKGLIGFPINAVLDWPMATPAGTVAFLRDDVNGGFKKILDDYNVFLASPDSASVLTTDPDGWFSEVALAAMSEVASQGYGPISFDDAYYCIPDAAAKGYKSWDDFFTRRFREGVRPIYEENDDTYIVNCCESHPYRIQANVKAQDDFWLKGQPYSLMEMLDSSDDANTFQGGTVYQAFLSALSYHRWHAPVSGEIVSVQNIPGTYYAENYWEGFANIDPSTHLPVPDPSAPNNSQAYIAQIASRAVMIIKADDPRIGTMAIVTIGMAEVSSCEWTVKEGHVNKGDEIGMFHFGGSTHCLVFQPGVKLEFVKDPAEGVNLPVRGQLAKVVNGPLS